MQTPRPHANTHTRHCWALGLQKASACDVWEIGDFPTDYSSISASCKTKVWLSSWTELSLLGRRRPSGGRQWCFCSHSATKRVPTTWTTCHSCFEVLSTSPSTLTNECCSPHGTVSTPSPRYLCCRIWAQLPLVTPFRSVLSVIRTKNC